MAIAETASTVGGVPFDYHAIESADAEEAAARQSDARRLAREQNMRIEFVHAHGDPATELALLAHQLRVDLIVVGRSARILHALMGSVANRLSRIRNAPVVVVVP